ncbi:MAG TPA: AarF/UbiB family protein [Gaiellaceae bacterium]|nr:AarF/UbiB family protein [Gaiellaceae bacterium]HVP75206.1 AarF/UbiB family protein [Gaiellaceae bacterium]
MPQFAIGWAILVFFGLRWLSARLLGVRIGFVAALACAALGIGAGFGLQRAVAGGQGGVAPFFTFVLVSLLATMMLVAALSFVSKPTRGPFAAAPMGRPRPLRAIRMRISRTRRYFGILWLGARYGLGPLTAFRRPRDERELGVALRDGLQEAGGVFVKFGQLLSARTDLVPATIALELSSLQDNVAPVPAEDLRCVIRSELGPRADELLADFDERPLAAASIAQVHRARLADGAEVVVKVERPGIERLVARDLDILLRMSTSLEERAVWARRIGSAALAQGFADNVNEELDFRVEAQNMAAVTANDGALRIPRVYPDLSTRRVLVEEWIDGKPLREARDGLTPAEQKQLARTLLDGILRQIFESGVFHGDPHAGNVLVDADGRIALLDFGSVGRLDRLQLPVLAQTLAAIARRNAAQLRDALVELSTAEEPVDLDGLERGLARFFAERLGPGSEPGAEILNDLLRLVVRYGLALDPQLAGVFRSFATLEGTLRVIDPTFNVVVESQRWAQDRHLGLPRPAQLREDVVDDMIQLLPALRRIPRRLDHITGALEHGELSLRIRPFAHPHDTDFIVRLTNRLILAFFTASIGLVAVFLLRTGGGPKLFGKQVDELLGYGGLVAATILGLRVIVAVSRDGG